MFTGFMRHFLFTLITILCVSQTSAQSGKMVEYSVIQKILARGTAGFLQRATYTKDAA
jgi:hypothetical protein